MSLLNSNSYSKLTSSYFENGESIGFTSVVSVTRKADEKQRQIMYEIFLKTSSRRSKVKVVLLLRESGVLVLDETYLIKM